jgi:hypothetical protein
MLRLSLRRIGTDRLISWGLRIGHCLVRLSVFRAGV